MIESAEYDSKTSHVRMRLVIILTLFKGKWRDTKTVENRNKS